jgi:hypothetical protein
MSEMSRLERRYRRLLAWYPVQHRRTYGEEMIGVLLASAPDGQQRPRLADTADLIRGGLRTRLRQIRAGHMDPKWRDALAVYSVAVPAMWIIGIVAGSAAGTYRWIVELGPGASLASRLMPLLAPAVVLALIAMPVAVAWRRHPRSAALLALLPAGLLTFKSVSSFATPGAAFGATNSILLVTEAIALAASPGPRRGVRVMRPRAWIGVTVAGLALSASNLVFATASITGQLIILTAAAAVAAVGFMTTLGPAVSRRVLLMLAPAPLGAIAFICAGRYPAIWTSLQVGYFGALALLIVLGILMSLPRSRVEAHDRVS